MPRYHNINGERVQFTADEETARDAEEQAWADAADTRSAVAVRAERDYILSTVVDPMVCNPLRWADLTSKQTYEWSLFRTDLLDLPAQAGFPNTITWPTKPS